MGDGVLLEGWMIMERKNSWCKKGADLVKLVFILIPPRFIVLKLHLKIT